MDRPDDRGRDTTFGVELPDNPSEDTALMLARVDRGRRTVAGREDVKALHLYLATGRECEPHHVEVWLASAA